MVNIFDRTIEKIKRSMPIKTTVNDYITWRFGVDVESIDLDYFQKVNVDSESLEKYFEGDYSRQLEFLKEHRDDKIIIVQNKVNSADIYTTFFIDNIVFNCVQCGYYKLN